MRGLLLLAACTVSLPANANEGMWTFDNFPSTAVRQGFGSDITAAWLDQLHPSFVSREGGQRGAKEIIDFLEQACEQASAVKLAINGSHDPMILLALSIDAEARAIRRQYADEVEAPIAKAAEVIAAARFKAYGTSMYPDATFTPCLNYRTVQGWVENGASLAPFTHLDHAFEGATGDAPFKIPDSWMRVKARLDMSTPFCISGNIYSIAGRYRFLRITAPSPRTRRSSVRHSKRYMVPRSCCGNCRRTKKTYTVIRSKMRDNSDQ